MSNPELEEMFSSKFPQSGVVCVSQEINFSTERSSELSKQLCMKKDLYLVIEFCNVCSSALL